MAKEPRGPKRVPVPVKPSETITMSSYTRSYDDVSLEGIINDILVFYEEKNNQVVDIDLSKIRVVLEEDYDYDYHNAWMSVKYDKEYTIKNKHYVQQLKKYEKDLAAYPEKLRVYEEKRAKYLIDLEAYRGKSYEDEKKKALNAYERAKKEMEKFQK
jgi:hypothetical protein